MVRRGKKHRVGHGHEGCSLPSSRYITRAEIGNDVDSGALGDHGGLAELPGGVRWIVPDGVPVRRDCRNVRPRHAALGDCGDGSVGEPASQVEVESRVFRWCGALKRCREASSFRFAVRPLDKRE